MKAKLQKFQKPHDFDAKLLMVARVVEEVGGALQLVDLGSQHVSELQEQCEVYQVGEGGFLKWGRGRGEGGRKGWVGL